MIKRIIEEIKKIPGVRTAFPVDDRIVVDLEEEVNDQELSSRETSEHLEQS